MIKQTFPYQGSKSRHLDNLFDYFPPHEAYVEVFGGSGIVLLRKEPKKYEVFNDYNYHVYNFFYQLRHNTLELISKISLTPYARAHHDKVTKQVKEDSSCEDDLEWAADWFVCQCQSFNGRIGAGMRNINHTDGFTNVVGLYKNKVKNLFAVAERMAHTLIESLDFQECIEKYDDEDVLFYLDPPYVGETKSDSSIYKSEMTDEDHVRMVDCLLEVDGNVLLSGYENEIYEPLTDNGYNKEKYTITERMSGNHSERNECLWFNYEPQPKQSKLV